VVVLAGWISLREGPSLAQFHSVLSFRLVRLLAPDDRAALQAKAGLAKRAVLVWERAELRDRRRMERYIFP
jgi:hypothetical protein